MNPLAVGIGSLKNDLFHYILLEKKPALANLGLLPDLVHGNLMQFEILKFNPINTGETTGWQNSHGNKVAASLLTY